MGPSPGAPVPEPPRAHVAKHLFAHASIALPFGPRTKDDKL